MKDKQKILKIGMVVLIVAIIIGMWLVKNPISENQEPSGSTEKLEGADFSLVVTEAVDFKALAEYGLPIIVDYGSDSCIPCKEMAPVLEAMNKEYEGKAFIKFADVWKYYEAASNVPVMMIPTQVFFNADGTPFVPSPELKKEIEFGMYYDEETKEHTFTTHVGGLTQEQFRMILDEMGVE